MLKSSVRNAESCDGEREDAGLSGWSDDATQVLADSTVIVKPWALVEGRGELTEVEESTSLADAGVNGRGDELLRSAAQTARIVWSLASESTSEYMESSDGGRMVELR